MTQGKVVEVAAAVLQRVDGRYLLAQRPPGKIWAGYWEFPGGKVEPGEMPRAALIRELREELGIEVITAYPWITRIFTYPHATVRLHFFRVTQWQGEPYPHEEQQFAWQTPGACSVSPVLPANTPILRALELPARYAISNVAELGEEEFLRRLERALADGLRLVQLREKQLPREPLRELAQRAVALAHAHGARILLNADVALARQVGADGVHLAAHQLAAAQQRPPLDWCAASCHSVAELRRAEALGCDFAVVGPVLPTASHPGAAVLGWERFAEITAGCAIPVYALGGMRPHDLEPAWRCGAHGVAMLRQAWVD